MLKLTNRRRFLAATATLAVGTTAFAIPVALMADKYPIVFHVFFWLKNPSSTEDCDKLVEGVKTLAKIETIHELRVGIVASTAKRDVVDNSWAVSELMFFKNLAGQATYQSHPIHLEFVKNYSHLWEKVIVYDAVGA